jgi:tetratricopeptide (TPR) repeat protein
MKKLAILIGLSLLISLGGFAQKNKRTSAYMYMQNGQLDKAKVSIDEAITHEKTIADAKTWLYRGEVYYQIATSPLAAYSELDPNALVVAYEALLNAKKYDVKGTYKDDISLYLGYLNQLFNSRGGESYNNGDYETANAEFINAYNVSVANGGFDSITAFNIGMTAVKIDQPEIAAEYLQKCIDVGYTEPIVYIYYSRSVKQLGDTVQAFEIVDKGLIEYPEELSLMLELAQLYLETDQKEKLLSSLLTAVEADPENSNLYFLIGKTYDDRAEYELAEEYYKKAAEVKPDFFEAYYNIGAIYVNQAAEAQVKANDLPLSETAKYDEYNQQATTFLERAVPYLEKSLEINPDDASTLTALKEAYARLKMNDKLEKLNK